MKKRIGIIVTVVVIVLVIGLLVWRFIPRSFSSVLPVDEASVTNFSASAMVIGYKDGEPHTDIYSVDSRNQEIEVLNELTDILAASSYRPDLRNLLPWGIDGVDADKNYDGRTVALNIYFKNSENEYSCFQFLSNSLAVVTTEEHPGWRIYHPTNAETLNALVEYLQSYKVTDNTVEVYSDESTDNTWTVQEISTLFETNKEKVHWAAMDYAVVSDAAFDRVGVVLFVDNETKSPKVAFMNADGSYALCGVEAQLSVPTELAYCGNGVVTFNLKTEEDMTYQCKITFSQSEDGKETNFIVENNLDEILSQK